MISPVPKESDINSAPWKKWFSSIFAAFKNIDTNGDVVINDNARGLVIKDSSGNYWRISISTSGVISGTNLGTTKPQGVQ